MPLDEVTGSYAGAMGSGQFMPSSYLEYAVDWMRTVDATCGVPCRT